MALMQNPQLLQKEGRLLLTKYAIQNNSFLSVRKATKSYNVPRTTLRHWIKGSLLIAKLNSQKRKLKLSKEQALVQWILDLNRREFPPQIINVRKMADTLLIARGCNPPPQPVGKNQVSYFINNQPKLKTKWN